MIVFLGGLVWFLRHGGFHAEREETPYYSDPPSAVGDGPADKPEDRDESEEVQADG